VIRLAVLTLVLAWAGAADATPRRVLSLDQCADQYVLALVPRSQIVGLSHRADDLDSYLRTRAGRLPQRRASLEAVFAARPELVVRYWGGDAALLRALERRGVRSVTIEEVSDFAGVRANVQRVARAAGREAEGRALLLAMDQRLASAAGAWRGQPALYLTPGSYTAGQGTLVASILEAAGLRSLAPAGYSLMPLERLVLSPPSMFVLGFFDMARFTRWQVARHPVLARVRRGRPAVRLPAAVLGCPGWFAADAAVALAEAAPPR
jgi:iron complex transport system substrate-binding protein